MDQPLSGITLADGTALEESSCGYSGNDLWCWNKNMSLVDAISIFNNTEKTKEITAWYYKSRIIYKGFTKIMIVRRGMDELGKETIDVCLTWPEGGEHSIEEITE